jgi:putative ABC transport system permease protein
MVTPLSLLAATRHYSRHPWQLLLAVAGVALGVAVVVAVDIANASSQRAFDLAMSRVTGTATHQIIGGPAGLDDEIYIRLRLSGLRGSAPLIEAFGRSDGETLHLLGVDPLVEGGFRSDFARVGEADLGALMARPNTALLAESTARRLGIRAGDRLPLTLGGRDISLEIVATIPRPADQSPGIDDLVITDVATAQELTGMAGRLSWIDLKIPKGAAAAKTLEAIRRFLPPGAEVLPAQSRVNAMDQMTRAFRTNLSAMSLLSLLVGMFLIYNTMTFAILQRRSHLACLRLVGVTPREILTITLSESVAIAIIATSIGLAAGVALGHALLSLVTRTINDLYFVLTVTRVEISPWSLIYGAGLGIGATLVAAAAPALEASLTPPRAALLRSTLEAKSLATAPRLAIVGAGTLFAAGVVLLWPTRSMVMGFIGLFFFMLGVAFLSPWLAVRVARGLDLLVGKRAPPAVHLAIRGVPASLSRTAVAMAALMIAVATIIGVGVMIQSFRSTVSDWLESSLQADIYVSTPGFGANRGDRRLDPQLIEAIVSLPIVQMHTTGRSVLIESENDLLDLFVLDPPPGITPHYPIKEAAIAEVWSRFRRGDLVLVSEPLAYRRHLAAGDTIEMRTDHGMRRFPIGAIYYDYSSSQGQVLMPRALYAREFDDPGISGLALYLQPGVAIDDAMNAIRAVLAKTHETVNVRSNRELRELSMRIFDRTFTVTEVLRLLAVLVAIIGIFDSLMALQLERSREVGLLRALGYTPGQVYATAMTQTGVVGLIAGLIALPTGTLLALLLIHVINVRSFGWSLHTVVNPGALAGGVAIAVVAALIAGIYPARNMSRASPVVVLRNE